MRKVSVIVPTYNRADFLRGAVVSVLNQTFQDFELVLVDNGSGDHTRDVVSSFTDDRIRYIRIDINSGVSAARNLGIMRSEGEYVAFLDDDDQWLPDKLGLQVGLMEQSPRVVGGVYTGFLIVERASGAITGRVEPTRRGNLFDDLCISNCVGTASTVLLRRDCAVKAGLFDEEIVFGEEYDLWIRIAQKFEFECIAEPLVIYSVHGNNSNAIYDKTIRGKEAQLRKHRPLLNRKALSHRYMQLGEMYCYNGDTRRGIKSLLRAIRSYPFVVKHYYNLGLSLFGARTFKRVKQSKDRLMAKRLGTVDPLV